MRPVWWYVEEVKESSPTAEEVVEEFVCPQKQRKQIQESVKGASRKWRNRLCGITESRMPISVLLPCPVSERRVKSCERRVSFLAETPTRPFVRSPILSHVPRTIHSAFLSSTLQPSVSSSPREQQIPSPLAVDLVRRSSSRPTFPPESILWMFHSIPLHRTVSLGRGGMALLSYYPRMVAPSKSA